MENRCTCLHDTRISSKDAEWWLPHCALRSNKLDTDAHIDDFDQYQHAMLHYGHPFGQGVTMESFAEFYDMIILGGEKSIISSAAGDSNCVVSRCSLLL